MMRIWIQTIFALLAVLAVTVTFAAAPAPYPIEAAPSYQRFIPKIGWVDFRVLIASGGGRVSWYKGDEHERIAFDAEVEPGRIEVYTIHPDGTELRCISCASPGLEFARKLSSADRYGEFVGQPEWYPLGGNLLLVQVENEHSRGTYQEHLSWGINNDLWMLKVDGSEAQKVYDTPVGRAALHPHFNRFGTELIFASKLPSLNPWRYWHIHKSDVDISRIGQNRLTTHTALQPAGPGFYETHGFNGLLQGWMTFSFTPDSVTGYVQDSFVSTTDGALLRNLTHEPTSWTEHATYSPSEASYAYNSSSPFNWQPGDGWAKLRTELLLEKGAVTYQITAMNQDRDPTRYQYVVSDFDWDREGRRLVVQVAVNAVGGLPQWVELWVVTFPVPQ